MTREGLHFIREISEAYQAMEQVPVLEAKVKALGESGGTVEFAFELRSIESSSPAGYKYQAVPLIEPQETEDELGALVAMSEGRKMLEAPVTTVAEAPTGKKK